MYDYIKINYRKGKYLFLYSVLLVLSFCDVMYAAEKVPESIYGTYTMSKEICFVANNKTGMECEGYGNDVIEIKPTKRGAVSVSIDLIFFNGHTCGFEGKGSWKNNMLVVPAKDCTVYLRFRDNAVMTRTNDECVTAMYCGARGSLGGTKLYKRKGLKGEEPPKPTIEALGEPLNTLWDANTELNHSYKRLSDGLDKTKQIMLRNDQRKWIIARDRQCKSALPKSGSEEWLRYVAEDEKRAQCVLDATRKRTKELLNRGF
jgi:hypothetical protein